MSQQDTGPVASNDERIVRALEEIAGALHRIEDHLRSVIMVESSPDSKKQTGSINVWDNSR